MAESSGPQPIVPRTDEPLGEQNGDKHRYFRSIIARAAEALAQELPWGNRRRELNTLVRSLDQNDTSSQWTNSLKHSLELHDDQAALGLWMNRVSRESQVSSRRSRAWLYPLFVFALSIGVMMFLSPTVIKPFREFHHDLGMSLPADTAFVFYVCEHLFGNPLVLLACIALAIVFGYGVIRLINHYSLLTRYCSWLVVGKSSNISALANFTGMLAHLLNDGMPLPDALEESGRSCGHNHFAFVGKQLAQYLRAGKGRLHHADAASSLPRNVIDALEPQDSAPPNLGLLRELSILYEERVTARIEWAGEIVGVYGILAVGAVVLFVVISLFIPLFNLIIVY